MKVYEGLENFVKQGRAVVTSGTFDGVHKGHQKILKKVVDLSKEINGESILLTFWPHPRLILNPDDSLHLINTFEEKIELLESFGIDHLVKLPFTKEFSQMSSIDFVNKILVEGLGTKKLVIGYNHRFGRNREGGFEFLSENAHSFGFEVFEIPRQEIDEIGISSTKIRDFISKGNVEEASKLLGHNYSLSGTVVSGDKIGRAIGFPTANILLNSKNKLIPQDGVYVVTITVGGRSYNGMLYIGDRPTLNGKHKTIEVNIFDFEEDIYGRSIKVDFLKMLRSDLKFNNLSDLKNQLKKDQVESQIYFSNEYKTT